MKIILTLLLTITFSGSYAQFSADGFFVQKNMYIDPFLLKKNRVDSFVIRFNAENYISYYLDSNYNVRRKVFYSAGQISEYRYDDNGLNNYACYVFPKEKIVCENNRIVKYSQKKNRTKNIFDGYGRTLLSIVKHKGNIQYERYYYNADGSIQKVEEESPHIRNVFQFEYIRYQLVKIKQLTSLRLKDSLPELNEVSFEYYKCGLFKKRTGYFMNGRTSLSCEVFYYADGLVLE